MRGRSSRLGCLLEAARCFIGDAWPASHQLDVRAVAAMPRVAGEFGEELLSRRGRFFISLKGCIRRVIGPRDHHDLAAIHWRGFVTLHVGQAGEDAPAASHRDPDRPRSWLCFTEEILLLCLK